jgi:glycosyltransferase involved in cell wall biosynthesis
VSTPSSAAPARLSACIITFNEADRITACIDSLRFCDEVVVVDSHSTDNTRELAQAAGARVIERDWPGYRTQKDFAVRSATHDWVLIIDADERVSPELAAEIGALRDQGFPGHTGWTMPRITYYFGRFLRHGNSYLAHIERLLDRRHGGVRGREIHERTESDGKVGKLTGMLEHYSYRSLSDHNKRMEKYSTLMAETWFKEGKRTNFSKVIFNPWWCFVRGYFLSLGFLDGWQGWCFAYVEANYVFQKHMKCYLLQKGEAP